MWEWELNAKARIAKIILLREFFSKLWNIWLYFDNCLTKFGSEIETSCVRLWLSFLIKIAKFFIKLNYWQQVFMIFIRMPFVVQYNTKVTFQNFQQLFSTCMSQIFHKTIITFHRYNSHICLCVALAWPTFMYDWTAKPQVLLLSHVRM